MKMKNQKLAEDFMKFMTDMGATFIDVTPKKDKRLKKSVITGENYLPKLKK